MSENRRFSASGGERRAAKHRVDRRRELNFHTYMGKQNNITARKTMILAMLFNEQKVNIFRCRIDIRDELARHEPARLGPAQPCRSLTVYFSNVFEDTNSKVSRHIGCVEFS